MYVPATIWLRYCRRGVKQQSINQSILSVSHVNADTLLTILVDSEDKSDIIRRYYTVSDIKDLFTNVAGDKLLKYSKDVGLYSRI